LASENALKNHSILFGTMSHFTTYPLPMKHLFQIQTVFQFPQMFFEAFSDKNQKQAMQEIEAGSCDALIRLNYV